MTTIRLKLDDSVTETSCMHCMLHAPQPGLHGECLAFDEALRYHPAGHADYMHPVRLQVCRDAAAKD